MDAPRNKNRIVGQAEPPLVPEASPRKAATGKTTTRVELLDAVYTACPSLSRAQARELFEMTLDEIVGALLSGDAVKLRAFGAFNVRSKRERIGRNPRNGVEATINARRVLTFKASPTLIARVNGWTAPFGEED
ncbi:integration host factor subunit alpha [Rhodoblastus acidophilus]|uniref:Integration host factor subunit alpha n=1 Tax=Candidatus Rhodoblastus alkanivorans TaxID=2954117 RepID=A0ABS9Z2S7_9HYPH|nr:integration host factor subunit alpha [Candidatus Rhodoblastus alkanivorans]MCI4677549.1 integration host factor subunit alpha [Candidatus Rhodoblastus alkanivorans]MCI4681908.1 integration host factor subunit alpha [Candidatus Rhodoblastus alkanivorans]MDI4642958.1 integration host factor subunit alpha [Rhodoblastus acidophilus]